MTLRYGEYFVGSLPPKLANARTALQFQRDRTGRALCFVGGEVRPKEQDWVANTCREIAQAVGVPSAKVLRGSRYLDYGPRMGLGRIATRRIGRNIAAGKLPTLQYGEFAVEDRQIFDGMEAGSPTGARFVRSIGSPLAYLHFSGVPSVYLPAFEDLMIQANKVALESPDGSSDTVLQAELPWEMAIGVLTHTSYDGYYASYAESLQSTERVIRATPLGTWIAFHPVCWGDLGGKPLVPPALQSPLAKIAMINAVLDMSVWREGWNLFSIHDSFGDGRHAPRLSQEVIDLYRGKLEVDKLPARTIYVIGAASQHASAEETQDLVERFAPVLNQDGVDREVGIATSCGMGRTSLPAAKRTISRMNQVVRAMNR